MQLISLIAFLVIVVTICQGFPSMNLANIAFGNDENEEGDINTEIIRRLLNEMTENEQKKKASRALEMRGFNEIVKQIQKSLEEQLRLQLQKQMQQNKENQKAKQAKQAQTNKKKASDLKGLGRL